jgi:aminoglycoside 9-adenylyltransferase
MTAPPIAIQVMDLLKEILKDKLEAIYLYGSAVHGGLKKDSDIDMFAVINSGLGNLERKLMIEGLMAISGEIGNRQGKRYLELTISTSDELKENQYPVFREFQYGEWLREEFKKGYLSEKIADPDMTVLLAQLKQSSIALLGKEAELMIPNISKTQLNLAMQDSVQELVNNFEGDERNVLLTLARILATTETGEFMPKEKAGAYILPLLNKSQQETMNLAINGYLGKANDDWGDRKASSTELLNFLLEKMAQS